MARLPRRAVDEIRQRRLARWVRAARAGEPPLEGPVRLIAVIGTWMEADIIESTVANAIVQGCERVLLVDNDSPDDTVARAVGAGAELAATFATSEHDDRQRVRRMTEAAAAAAATTGAAHVWALFLDADELPHGPGSSTIVEHLTTVEGTARVVGSRTFNHFPSGPIAHQRGRHPVDFQPLCQERRGTACRLGHWKHPLVRFDESGPPLSSGIGFHVIEASDQVVEAREPIISHHVPYRNEADTRVRLAALAAPGPDGSTRLTDEPWAMGRRPANVDAIYAQAWDRVDVFDMVTSGDRLAPRPWADVAPEGDPRFHRWYDASDHAER